MFKRESGITLVALIITIIILIILAAVSITALMNTNLIGWAGDAAGNYIDAASAENDTLSLYESRWISLDTSLSSKLNGGGE